MGYDWLPDEFVANKTVCRCLKRNEGNVDQGYQGNQGNQKTGNPTASARPVKKAKKVGAGQAVKVDQPVLVKPISEEAPARRWSVRRALLVLAGSTVLIAWMNEILVGAIEPTTRATAVLNNRMDLPLSIAVGASVQIALFVAPLLVLLSDVVGSRPMDLMLRPGLVFSVFFSVWIAARVAGDGESEWLKGATACPLRDPRHSVLLCTHTRFPCGNGMTRGVHSLNAGAIT
jgi:Ca2+/H+ antiporter